MIRLRPPARFFRMRPCAPNCRRSHRCGEADDWRSQQAVQGHAIFVGDVVDTVPIAKLLATDGEGMEVAVIPPHRPLDRLVQVAKRLIVRAWPAGARSAAWCRAASPSE